MNKQLLPHSKAPKAHWALLLAALACTAPAARPDSLWAEHAPARSMLSDRKAVAVGDIVSILVQESSLASKDTSAKSSKKSGLDASISSFLYPPQTSGLLTKGGKLPALKLDSKNEFDGSGQIANSEKIVARIAATVVDVLPNGNLLIEGTRQTAFSGETQDAILRGVVRSADISANNTIYSYNVAEATIRYVSKGAASNATKKGWFSRVWDKVAPF